LRDGGAVTHPVARVQPETIFATVVAAMDRRRMVVRVIDNVLGLSATRAILGG
jgi:hypothetical protein